MMNHSIALGSLGCLVCLAASGCAAAEEEAVAQAVVTSALSTNENGGVGKEFVEAVDDTCLSDPEAAVRDAASRPSVVFIPSTCVDKSADGNRLHAELTGCKGRFGRTVVEGGLDALVTSTKECALHADIADSGNLAANGAPLTYEAAADVRLVDGQRQVDWSAGWSGITPRGRAIEQKSQLDIVEDPQTECVDVVGVAEGRVERHAYDLVIEELAACPDECPSAGTVRATLKGNLRDRTVTVRFDGSSTAKVTGWTGRRYDVEMICDPVAGQDG